MATLLSASSLKAFFDANPKRYKSPMAGGDAPEADGYLSSRWLDYQLCTPEGNGKTKPNRNPVRPQIPKPFGMSDLFGSNGIGDASAKKAVDSPARLADAIEAQDRRFLNRWASLNRAVGNITAAELTAVQTILQATIPDPDWKATVPICDLEAYFVDGQGKAPLRLEMARNEDGSRTIHSGIAFIDAALGRG